MALWRSTVPQLLSPFESRASSSLHWLTCDASEAVAYRLNELIPIYPITPSSTVAASETRFGMLRRCPDPAAFERANYQRILQSWRG